jgi:peptide chain release factor subunit 1
MLKSGIVDTLIITDEIPYMHLEIKCNKCGNIQEKFVERINLINVKQEEFSKSCPKCGSDDKEIIEKDIVDLLEELSVNSGTKMEVISSKTEEGAQLVSLGNIGALLRFKPSH